MNMIKPPKIGPGSVIGLIAPSSPVSEEDAAKGIAVLKEMGFKVKTGKHLLDKRGYLAGADRNRAADLNAMFVDPRVDAVFCACGGYGTSRILDLVDYETIKRQPKVFLGYSDITGLHLAIQRKVGMVTFHGPMVCGRTLNSLSRKGLLNAVTRPEPMGAVPKTQRARKALAPGVATGRLVGGNLSLIIPLIGTPYEPDWRGKILFIEDVNERPYRVDRYLAQLRLSGVLEKVAGVALGQFTHCEAPETDSSLGIEEVLQDYFGALAKPVVLGLAFGHEANNWTLPLGAMAKIDSGALTLTVTESAVGP